LYPELLSKNSIPVGKKDTVTRGSAYILSNIAGDSVEKYQIEIVKIINAERSTKNLYIRVTDPVLLSQTGGIVQGMSGSPIIQNGCIIGAVTHVLINDPVYGYGIFIENMLEYASANETLNAA
jgi:stage IV sporulation protein B